MKRSNTWFALILIASALLLSAAKQGSAASKNPRPNQHEKSPTKLPDAAQQQEEKEFLSTLQSSQAAFLETLRTIERQAKAEREENSPKPETYSSPSVRIQIGLLIVGVVYSILAALQWAAINRQAKISNKTLQMQFRPRIKVRNVVTQLIPVIKDEPEYDAILLGNSPIAGHFCIVNVGGTDATVTEVHAEVTWQYFELPMSRPYDEKTPHPLSNPVTLKSGQSITWPFESAIALDINPYRITRPDAWKDNQTRPPRRLYVLGVIVYVDDLGLERRTAFCRCLDPTIKRFVVVRDADYEHAE